MKRHFFYLYFFPFFVFIVSCSAPPVLRLSPLADETEWLDGREYARSSAGDIEVAAAFESLDETFVVFDVEITNLSAQAVLVSPEKFYALPLASPQDTVGLLAANHASNFAVDPEIKLLDIDKQMAREQASYATSTGIDAAVSLLDLVITVATIGTEKSEEEIKEEERARRENQIAHQEREIDHNNRLAELKNLKEKWQSTTLRRTTLNPNQTLFGKVYFPANSQARYVKLYFPLGEAEGQVIFEQKKYKP
jgi:hypothetical protein